MKLDCSNPIIQYWVLRNSIPSTEKEKLVFLLTQVVDFQERWKSQVPEIADKIIISKEVYDTFKKLNEEQCKNNIQQEKELWKSLFSATLEKQQSLFEVSFDSFESEADRVKINKTTQKSYTGTAAWDPILWIQGKIGQEKIVGLSNITHIQFGNEPQNRTNWIKHIIDISSKTCPITFKDWMKPYLLLIGKNTEKRRNYISFWLKNSTIDKKDLLFDHQIFDLINKIPENQIAKNPSIPLISTSTEEMIASKDLEDYFHLFLFSRWIESKKSSNLIEINSSLHFISKLTTEEPSFYNHWKKQWETRIISQNVLKIVQEMNEKENVIVDFQDFKSRAKKIDISPFSLIVQFLSCFYNSDEKDFWKYFHRVHAWLHRPNENTFAKRVFGLFPKSLTKDYEIHQMLWNQRIQRSKINDHLFLILERYGYSDAANKQSDHPFFTPYETTFFKDINSNVFEPENNLQILEDKELKSSWNARFYYLNFDLFIEENLFSSYSLEFLTFIWALYNEVADENDRFLRSNPTKIQKDFSKCETLSLKTLKFKKCLNENFTRWVSKVTGKKNFNIKPLYLSLLHVNKTDDQTSFDSFAGLLYVEKILSLFLTREVFKKYWQLKNVNMEVFEKFYERVRNLQKQTENLWTNKFPKASNKAFSNWKKQFYNASLLKQLLIYARNSTSGCLDPEFGKEYLFEGTCDPEDYSKIDTVSTQYNNSLIQEWKTLIGELENAKFVDVLNPEFHFAKPITPSVIAKLNTTLSEIK